MLFPEIFSRLVQQFGEDAFPENAPNVIQPYIVVRTELLTEVCFFLRNTEGLYFDYLSCLSGIDQSPTPEQMQVVYHLFSITQQHSLVLKVNLDRSQPRVPSVSAVWRTADWHEREAFDLLGVVFDNHTDLRRMFMPADWPGHPLRKDYVQPDEYHQISTK